MIIANNATIKFLYCLILYCEVKCTNTAEPAQWPPADNVPAMAEHYILAEWRIDFCSFFKSSL